MEEKKKMKKMKQIMALFLSLTMLMSLADGFSVQAFAAAKLTKPSVKSVKETGNANVTITWGKVKSAKKYQILRSTKKSGKGAKKLGTVKKTKFVDKTTKDGKTYYYSVKAVSGKKTASSKWKKFKTSGAPVLGDLHSSVTSALENTDNEALVTVQVKNYERLKSSALSLVDDTTDKTVGSLNDNGKNGDSIKGDGFYSVRISITGSAGDKKTYSVVYKKQKKTTEKINFFDEVTEEDIQIASDSASELANAAESAIGSDTVTSSSEAEKTIDAVYEKAQPLLSEEKAIYVGKTEDGVGIEFASGLRYIYNPHYADTDSGNADSLTAVGVLPFYNDTSEDSDNNKYLPTLKDGDENAKIIADTLDNVDYKNGLLNPDVTLTNIDDIFKDNSIVLWHGHGGFYDDGENEKVWGPNLLTDEFLDKDKKPTTEEAKALLAGGFLYGSSTFRVAIGANFINNNVESMENSFVYLGACHSMQSNLLADAFVSKGASVVGFSDSVACGYDEAVMKSLVKYMCTENADTGKYYTLTEALGKTKEDLGDNDDIYLTRRNNKTYSSENPAVLLYALADPVNDYRFSNKDFTLEKVLKAYREVYNESYNEDSNYKISLFYVDDNDIPEMAIGYGDDGMMPSFYTWYKNAVKGFGVDTIYGTNEIKEFRYIEKKGYFTYSDYTHSGGRTYTKLENGKLTQLIYLFEDDAYGGGAHGGDQITVGNGKAKSITPSQYQAYVKKYDKKYLKVAKSITMYSSFDDAVNALGK